MSNTEATLPQAAAPQAWVLLFSARSPAFFTVNPSLRIASTFLTPAFVPNVRSPEKLQAEVINSRVHWDQEGGTRRRAGEDAMQRWEPKRGALCWKTVPCWSWLTGAPKPAAHLSSPIPLPCSCLGSSKSSTYTMEIGQHCLSGLPPSLIPRAGYKMFVYYHLRSFKFGLDHCCMNQPNSVCSCIQSRFDPCFRG